MVRLTWPRAAMEMETILLVDDNPLRASIRKSLLESNTSAVVRALDAAEALCLVESPEIAQRLTLVITGHAMTGISGPEFVAEIRSRIPHLTVLVLGAGLGAEKEYPSTPNVLVAQSKSPEELRTLAHRLMAAEQRQTA